LFLLPQNSGGAKGAGGGGNGNKRGKKKAEKDDEADNANKKKEKNPVVKKVPSFNAPSTAFTFRGLSVIIRAVLM
jgi:hypothetical protein